VTKLVNGMFQIKSSKKRVPGYFGRPQDVASTVSFCFAESEQFLHTPLRVAPDPAVNRSQDPVEQSASFMKAIRRHERYEGFCVHSGTRARSSLARLYLNNVRCRIKSISPSGLSALNHTILHMNLLGALHGNAVSWKGKQNAPDAPVVSEVASCFRGKSWRTYSLNLRFAGRDRSGHV